MRLVSSYQRVGTLRISLLFFAFACFGLVSAICFAEEKSSVEESGRFLREGDSLADAGDYAGALLKYKEAYERQLPRLRGLEFKRSVTPKLMSKPRLREHMMGAVKEEYDQSELLMMDSTLKVFGLVPPNLDFEKTLVDLYADGVAGFYDPKDESMFLIGDTAPPPKKKGFLNNLFAPKGFDKLEQKVILAHELTHALTDQHFDINTLQEQAKLDDDRLLAAAALIEGDATVVMFAEQQRLQGQPANIHRMPPAVLDASFFVLKALLPFATTASFGRAPRIFTDSMIFPYHKGSVFVMHLTNHGGWKAVDQAWADIPLSTEQILHPKKYLQQPRDLPMELTILPLGDLLGERWDLLGKNVLGEFQIRVLLADVPFSTFAAAGWDGDQYLTYRAKDQPEERALVWLTTWDTEDDAREFGLAYQLHLQQRMGVWPATGETGPNQGMGLPEYTGSYEFEKDGRIFRILQNGFDVAVVEGLGSEVTAAVLDRIFDAARVPKTH